jgi:6-phosphofructokinase 2
LTQQTIITLTINPALDKSTKVQQVIPEHKLRCHDAHQEPGGGGLNVARAIYKLGGEALAIYMSGGLTGETLQHLLKIEGIKHQALPIEGWTRESFAVLEEGSQQQYRFVLPGPVLREAEWRAALDAFAALDPRPDWLVASGSLAPGVPDDFYAQLACLAARQGTKVIADTSGAALRALTQAEVFLLKPNLRELSQLVGRPLHDEAEQEQAAQALLQAGNAQAVVISLGGAGVLLVSPEESVRLRTPIVPIVSKIGAGDSLVAGLTLALAKPFVMASLPVRLA